MAIPATLESHFFAEHPRSQLVLLAEMHESNAGPLQLFDQVHHVRENLILHADHAYENLVALHLETAVSVYFFGLISATVNQGVC